MQMIRGNSMVVVVGAAVVLTLLSLAVPMTTSRGQGIDEYVVKDWRGVYLPSSHSFRIRFDYTDGSFAESPMSALALDQFTDKSSPDAWLTVPNPVSALQAAYTRDAGRLEHLLGTSGNAASLFHPFRSGPVGYSTAFLRTLAASSLNPDKFGGPNIPPGSVPYTKLKDGVLHVDTATDGNVIRQCPPGQTPAELASLTKG